MFVDEVRIVAKAGHGGKGCVSFHREAYRPKGGPDGGNGGRGGSVILQADHDLNNLIAQYYQPRLIARRGQNGMGKGMDGHAGEDLLVKVPCGTLIWRLAAADPGPEPSSASTGARSAPADPERNPLPVSSERRPIIATAGGERALELDDDEADGPDEGPVAGASSLASASERELVADLTQHGQELVLCRGGRGGLGNRNFATARNQAPRFAQPGEPGEEGTFLFELRLIADVGLVGFPNAGKSTLLTAISRARPKIAPYPFTTLHPQVGIVEYADYFRLMVCDVPGLLEGAHRNVGLGHSFLRHVRRCRMIVFILDMAGMDGRLPWDDYRVLVNELTQYDPALAEKPRLVVANKMDEPSAEVNLPKFKRRVPRTPVLKLAAGFGVGIEEFKDTIRERL